MADLDDFFAKKDKKKKTKKGFSKANTDVLAKNLEENDRKEQQEEEKANDAKRSLRIIETQPGGITNDVSNVMNRKLDALIIYKCGCIHLFPCILADAIISNCTYIIHSMSILATYIRHIASSNKTFTVLTSVGIGEYYAHSSIKTINGKFNNMYICYRLTQMIGWFMRTAKLITPV